MHKAPLPSSRAALVTIESRTPRVPFWQMLRSRVARRPRIGRILVAAFFGTTVLSSCFVINNTLYILDQPTISLTEAALSPFGDVIFRHVPRVKDLASGSYTLSSSTPFLPFTGNRTVVIGPSAHVIASAILQRAANCSITETVIQPVSGRYDTRQTIDLPNAQDYVHQLAGLATQADVFPRGCIDSALGKVSVLTAQPISVSSTIVRSADLNPSTEQLEVQTIDRAANTLTTTALTPGRVRSFTVVDVNGDGQMDIVAAGVGYGAGVSGNIVVFLNNGDGTFHTAATIASNGSTFVVDDVNGDGKPDIVIDNGFDTNATPIPGVATLLGHGDGTFGAATVSATTVLRVSGPMVTGDFNGDGKPDLLLFDQVLLGNGDGTFTAGPALPASVQAEIGFNAAVGDLDRDGKLDVVYTGAGFVQVLLGNGDGTFRIGARYASVGSPQQVAISEIDGDGNLDIVVGNASQGIFVPILDNFLQRIQILLGRGDGTFVAAPIVTGDIVSNSSAPQFATADFDGDGKLDVLVADNGTSNGLDVLPGDGRGGFGAAVRSATGIRAAMVVAVDLNGDGKPDIVAAGQDIAALPIVSTLLNQGGNHFAVEHDYSLPGVPTAIAVGDFDGDGHLDVAVALGSTTYQNASNGVYVLYGQADGTLTTPVRIDASVRVISLAAADVNGDGRADLAIADSGTLSQAGAVRVLLGRADRTFAATTLPATTATQFGAVAFGDINGDGKQDLLVGGTVPGATFGATTPYLYTYPGNGDGTFQAPLSEAALGMDGNGFNTIAIADFNNDGHVDVAVGNQADYTEVLLGRGDGTYVHSLLVLGEHPAAIVAADLDNDHYPELLIGTAGSGMALFKNAGTVAAWTATATTPPTAPPTTPTTGDFAITATPASGSIMAGQSVQTLVALAPTSDFSGSVTLSCSAGLPAGATCAFSRSTVALAGGVAASSSLTITTKPATALGLLAPGGRDGTTGGLFVATLGGASLLVRRRRQAVAKWLGLFVLAALLTSCGGDDGGSGNISAPATSVPTSYPVTITASGASVAHTATYTLTVH